MKLAIITPTAYLAATQSQEFHLILPEQLERSLAYRQFYASVPGYKILDNGANEDHRIPDHHLIAWAKRQEVQEIVVPDVLRDCDHTIQRCRQFKPLAYEHREFKYMAVIQGLNLAEVMKCAYFYATQDWISVLGIPRLLVDVIDQQARMSLYSALYNDKDFKRFQFHFLGSSSWVEEVVVLGASSARSMDTSYPVYMGLLGYDIAHNTWRHRPKSFFGWEYDEDTMRLVQSNIAKYSEWAHEGRHNW